MDRHEPEPEPEPLTAETAGATAPPSGDPVPTAPPRESPPAQYDRLGRRLYTLEELPAKVRLRVEHAGKWVAWSADGEHVVAAAERYEDLRAAVQRSGVMGTVKEWLEPQPNSWLGE